MRTLALIPERDMSAAFGDTRRGEQLDSPSLFYGLIEPQQARLLDVRWAALSPFAFNYLMAFWRTATNEGATAFLIDLPVTSAESVTCRANFDGDLSISGVTGGSATVSGRLSVMPVETVHPSDADAIALVALIATDV